MSVARVFKWQCDYCNEFADREGHGLPPGWRWIVGSPVTHACSFCEKAFTDHQKGHSGSLKTISNCPRF